MVDKVYAVEVNFVTNSLSMKNVLHFAKITAGDPTTAQLRTLAEAWKEVVRPQQPNIVSWTDFRATQVLGDGVTYDAVTCRQVGGTIQTGALTGTLAGFLAAESLPFHDTMSLALGTGLRGRSYRGKLQMGPFAESEQGANVWTAGTVSAAQALVDTFKGVYGAGGTDPDFRWGVFSRGIASGCFPDQNTRHHPLVHRQAGNAADAFHNITSAVCSAWVTTTRSRSD